MPLLAPGRSVRRGQVQPPPPLQPLLLGLSTLGLVMVLLAPVQQAGPRPSPQRACRLAPQGAVRHSAQDRRGPRQALG